MVTNKLKVYLSGSAKNVNEDFQSWRNRCQILTDNGYYEKLDFVDPMSFFNYTNKQPKTDKQCLDLFMWLIDQSDVLLCNLDYSNVSIGTGMEIEHAFCHDIPIIAFGEKPDTWYNWSETRSTVVFKTLDQAIEYINDTYVKAVC